MRFEIITFGCKVNQYESQLIREELARHGHVAAGRQDAVADLYVVNTCAVTARTESACRQRIRRLAREAPDATIIVTGCSAELKPEAFAGMAGVAAVIPQSRKAELIDHVLGSVGRGQPDGISSFQGHTRAFLKVQDGCNAFCAYCVVPYARSQLSSRPVREVVEEANRLVANGYKEIVLTGVHLGYYGRDPGGETDLAHLARALLEECPLERLRLSSIEAMELTDELLELAGRDRRFCPHFHLPLQSGDDAILTKMNRTYSTEQYLAVVERVRAALDRPSVTTDVIIGFPGETEENFANTLRVCQAMGFSRMHIFPYSDRPGTAAADLPDKCQDRVIWERRKRIEEQAAGLALEYKKQFRGETVRVLVEGKRDKSTGELCGYTDRYMRVVFGGPDSLMNSLVPVVITEVCPDHMTGMVVEDR